MIHLAFMVFGLLIFVAPVFGSEKGVEVHTFDVGVGTLNYNPLRYCDKEYINFLRDTYGMQCAYNEPFLWVNRQTWAPEDRKVLQEEYIDPISLVPFKYFLNDNAITLNDDKFKQQGDILLSFSRIINKQEKKFDLILQSNFGEMSSKDLLEQFKKEYVRCMPGRIYNEKNQLLVCLDNTDLEKELCSAGIICKAEGRSYFETTIVKNMSGSVLRHKYVQGPNGFFGEEIKAEQEIKQSALFLVLGLKSYLVVQLLWS